MSTLAKFDISEDTGFIPQDPPLKRLPPYFQPWEDVAEGLSQLLKKKQLRNAVDELPVLEFSENTLHSNEEWRRALVILSGIFQGYLWQEGEAGVPTKVPTKLAVPFNALSSRIGVKPVITYASCVLYNWGLRDSSLPKTEENLYALINHTGTDDESWFFMVHVLMELKAAPAIKAIADIIAARTEGDKDGIVCGLVIMESTLRSLTILIHSKFQEKCDPKIFFTVIRPYLCGTKGCDAFPNGVLYEGVDSERLQFRGASGVQTSIFQSIDALMGTQHEVEPADFLSEMRSYMPSKHQAFIKYVSEQPPLREYVIRSVYPKLVQQYNATVDALVRYRSEHIVLVTTYIVNQIKHSSDPSRNVKGTGGSPFMRFLKSVRDMTEALKIK